MRLHQDTREEEHIGTRDLTRWPSALGRRLARGALTLSRWVTANVVLAILVTAAAAIVIGLTEASAEIYEAVYDGTGLARWDRPVLDAAINSRTAASTYVVTIFTHLGGPVWMTVIAAAITVTMTLVWRSWTPLTLMLIGVAGSLLMTTVGKDLVGRVRPPQADAVPPYESSPSFPSGHTLNSTVIAGIVAYLLLRRLSSKLARTLTVVLAAGWAVAMGLSRVFLGHHWLTDVVIGWTLGLAWVGAIILAHRLFLTVRRSRQPAQTQA
jgi:membrane-associated phospholipid phosphatase